MQRTSLRCARSPLTLRLDEPAKRGSSRISVRASRATLRACRRLNGSPHRSAQLTRRPSVLLASVIARPESPRTSSPRGYLVLAHLARTRTPASGCLAHLGATRQPRPLRPRSATAPANRGLSMPIFPAHVLQGTLPSSPLPANTTRSVVARLRSPSQSGTSAASTRSSNPACSGLAQLRCARH